MKAVVALRHSLAFVDKCASVMRAPDEYRTSMEKVIETASRTSVGPADDRLQGHLRKVLRSNAADVHGRGFPMA